jgi:apolipoprotein N-acyltransferase
MALHPGFARIKAQVVAAMNESVDAPSHKPGCPLRQDLLMAMGWTFVAIGCLHLAYVWNPARPLVAVYLFALVQLGMRERWRLAFYPGMVVGFCAGMLHLGFLYTIFSYAAVALWLVFAVWIGLFAALARLALRRFGAMRGLLALPFLWIGLEFFRSELYYLRFSWVTPGFAFSNPPWETGFSTLGVYGVGFFIMCLVCGVMLFRGLAGRTTGMVAVIAALTVLPRFDMEGEAGTAANHVKVAGVQMEFPSEGEVMVRLREIARKHPEAELIVLSEYTFDGPVPRKVLDWCAANKRYVIAGGKEPAANGGFYNTAYVISPEGQIVFEQVKAIPIQFMKDGFPAKRQQVWNSPWGRIGILICYDLSYTRVTDALVRQGAEVLIVPTMDVIDWGRSQHELHARVAPVRAAEYGLPIFRVASSGISQHVDRTGGTLASAPFPGDGAVIAAGLDLRGPGRLPLDRWLGPGGVFFTGTFILFLLASRWKRGSRPRGEAANEIGGKITLGSVIHR